MLSGPEGEMRNCLRLAIVLAVSVVPTLASAETLDLVCRGTTRAYQQAGAAVFNSRNGSANGFGAASRVDSRSDEFLVRIEGEPGGETGRVAPPPALVPWLTGAGLGDGWWGLKDVSVSDNRIVGTYSHSLIYSPRVTIDRRTGAIDVRALAGDEFTGTCEPAPIPEPDAASARRF
jgi:hypothetical protein